MRTSADSMQFLRKVRTKTTLILVLLTHLSAAQTLPTKSGLLNVPFLEWRIENSEYTGNPFDVIAVVTFEHQETGEVKKSLMFYEGDEVWKFRFTGTKTGEWFFFTEGPGKLNAKTGKVMITESPSIQKGFLKAKGSKWWWDGTQEEHWPQLVMSKRLNSYWKNGSVDTAAIDGEINEFITETGFNGFHKESVAASWFDISTTSINTGDFGPDANPDPRAFDALEEFVIRAYKVGASTHMWLWGSDAYKVGWNDRNGPDGIGGPMSAADQRLNRYIAARMGPIPGWSMGYGYDLETYTDAGKLQQWYEFLKGYLYQWPHLIGARGDRRDVDNIKIDPDGDGFKGIIYRTKMEYGKDQVFWTGGDYIGFYDYRVPYLWYLKSGAFGANRNKPVLQEDRFRIRESSKFFFKDYTPELERRGLWHCMMAGGVGNIWGNAVPSYDNGGSQPYDNKAIGSVQKVLEFEVDMKDQVKLWSDFFLKQKHFRSDYVLANDLTDYQSGLTLWEQSPTGGNITVGLRTTDYKKLIFYTENASMITIDLSNMPSSQPAKAVNVITGEVRNLSKLRPKKYINMPLGNSSDWVIAIGHF